MTKKILPYLVLLLLIFTSLKFANASEVTGNLNPGLDTGIAGVNKAAPTLSPAAGTYHSTQTVSLTAAGATKVCYTTDGTTEPACSSATTCSAGTALASGGTVSTALTTTLKSVACYGDNSQGPVASSIYSLTCSAVSNAATYAAYPSCAVASCNSGYSLNNGACVVQSNGGGGGGSITNCTTVNYADWNSSCSGNLQFRSVLSQSPNGCSLTTTQQLAAQRTCQINASTQAGTTTTTTTTKEPSNVVPTNENILNNIQSESEIISTNNVNSLLAHLGDTADSEMEEAGLVKYKAILGSDRKITNAEKYTINDFIIYGTLTTQRLGAGERAAVINSYFQAYAKLPNSESEWSDVIKIANGRWPVERSTIAENQAKVEFKKVYVRNAVMTNNIDQNAIMVIAYGLLPLDRNMVSEKVAIKTFKWVYGHNPENALAWNIVRAIAYSGAKR